MQLAPCASGLLEVIPCQAITAPAALVASPAVYHRQVGSSNLQGLQHVHSGLPTLSNLRMCVQPNSSSVFRPIACPTVHQERL